MPVTQGRTQQRCDLPVLRRCTPARSPTPCGIAMRRPHRHGRLPWEGPSSVAVGAGEAVAGVCPDGRGHAERGGVEAGSRRGGAASCGAEEDRGPGCRPTPGAHRTPGRPLPTPGTGTREVGGGTSRVARQPCRMPPGAMETRQTAWSCVVGRRSRLDGLIGKSVRGRPSRPDPAARGHRDPPSYQRRGDESAADDNRPDGIGRTASAVPCRPAAAGCPAETARYDPASTVLAPAVPARTDCPVCPPRRAGGTRQAVSAGHGHSKEAWTASSTRPTDSCRKLSV